MSPTDAPASSAQAVAPRHLTWLEKELDAWVADDLVTGDASAAIRARYVESRTLSYARILLFLGGAFVGIGLLWLVAANLEELPPLFRFIAVTMIWLVFTAAAELVAYRRKASDAHRSSPVVGTLRIMSALTYGAVIMQAAQSLQVPAFEPLLLGAWGIGVLLYAYAVRGVAALLIGIVISSAWFVWQTLDAAESALTAVLAVLAAGAAAAATATLHESRWLPDFAAPWREAGALLTLGGLFVAALPYVDSRDFEWTAVLVAGLVTAAAIAIAALGFSTGRERLDVLLALGAAGAGALLILWDPAVPDRGEAVSAQAWVSAFVSVGVYVGAAGAIAVLGVLRDSGRLKWVATSALVVFTTVQSFAVFAPVMSGATLFLLLGAIFLGTGYGFDRARREVVASLDGGE